MLLVCLSISGAAFVIVYQSSLTIEIIESSLTRHVAQYLIEKSTQGLVVGELTTLHTWLMVVSSLLFLGTILTGLVVRSLLARLARATEY